MTSRDFCYLLQGYFELTGTDRTLPLSAEQVAIIKAHLAMVFVHEIDHDAAKAQGPMPPSYQTHGSSPIMRC